MNRRELVAALAERSDTDKRSADEALQAFIDVVTETVASGEAVAISGFAKFIRRDIAAKPRRMGRNPATGEEMMLKPKPASKTVRITPLKAFKDAVLTGRRAPTKKTAAKKTAVKRPTAARKAAAKKSGTKKTAKRATTKKTTRRR